MYHKLKKLQNKGFQQSF